MENEIGFQEEWLEVKDYEFKILTLVAVLSDHKLAYSGTLSEMCEFFGVGCNNVNNKKIKVALDNLQQKGFLLVYVTGRQYTVALDIKARNKSKIIKIKKSWVKLIQDYQAQSKADSVAWENILRVLLYLIGDKTEIKKYAIIADALNISESIVKRSIKVLTNIDFGDNLEFRKQVKYSKLSNGNYRSLGQEMEFIYNFRD